MPYSLFLASFAAGLLLCNAIPHLAAGLRGERFPTPFATPPGKGKSSAVTNALWGTANLIAGLLLKSVSLITIGLNEGSVCFFSAFALCAILTAQHFAQVCDSDKANKE